MKNPPVLLGVCVLLLSGLSVSAVSVDVRPNRQQFFRGDGFSVSCADVQTDGWTVKRTQKDGDKTQTCGNGEGEFGRMDGVSCVVSFLVSKSSGVYWCETSSGQQSEQVSITVTDDNVILDIPALPVETGSDVTLRCRYRDGSTVEAEFLKNGRKLSSVPVEEWPISVDHLSDLDLYSCYIPYVGDSPQSRLKVKVPTPSDPGSSPDPVPGLPASIISAIVAVVLLVLLVLVLLLWKKHKGHGGSSPPVDVTYADVTVAQAANRSDKHRGVAETVYAGIKTNTEGAEDVTYSHVVIQGQRSSRQNHAQSSDPDVVYSSVRPRNT